MDLARLRESLRRLAPGSIPGEARPLEPVATGVSELDAALAWGGFPAGRLSELAGAPSSGKMALALSALAHHTRAGALCAFVDGTAQLYPPAAAALGVDLSRLLVVRPRADVAAALRAVEVLARSRAFAIIAVDLPADVRLEHALARRLGAAAQSGRAAVLLLTPLPGAAAGAALRLETWQPAPGRVAVRVGKGGATPGARAELRLGPHRFDDTPAAPLPPATTRRHPGEEP